MLDDATRQASERLGSVLRGKYVLDRVLGVGGMAAVYAATHRNTKRFAVKMLHPQLSLSDTMRARFLREGYVANTVDHPGAVAVLDDDTTEDGAAFLVMELLHGCSVEQLAEALGGRVSVEVTLAIAYQVLDVLDAAHAKSIVHRDVKPANLFLLTDGTVKVLDFGIARLRDATPGAMTTSAGVLGTPAFMAPELALASSSGVDGRTDVWAVGATMFTLMTGQLVHEGENAQQLMVRSATQPARSLGVVLPEAQPAVVAIVDRALAFDRAGRWTTAAEMRAAIGEAFEALFGAMPSPAVIAPFVGRAIAVPATIADGFAPTAEAPPPPERPATPAAVQANVTTAGAATLPVRPRRMPILWGGIALIAAASALVYVRGANEARNGEHPAVTPSASQARPASSVELTAPAPLRHPCAGNAGGCSGDAVAWCDIEERSIACCARDLVATGVDGVCACPPGGDKADGGTSGCPRGKEMTGIDAAVVGLVPQFRQCRKGDLGALGKMTVSVELTPEGRIFRARVAEGRMANAEVQKCVLDAIRTLTFSPPPGGTWSMTVPVSFTDADAGGAPASSGGRKQ